MPILRLYPRQNKRRHSPRSMATCAGHVSGGGQDVAWHRMDAGSCGDEASFGAAAKKRLPPAARDWVAARLRFGKKAYEHRGARLCTTVHFFYPPTPQHHPYARNAARTRLVSVSRQ